jgi:hypothetical protein
MARQYEEISAQLEEWIGQQRVFFVATAPLAADGLLNCSPKGMDTFRVLGPREVAYLDLTGSGIETVAHLRENSRILFMFCAFEGPPRIVRLHGDGEVLTPGAPGYDELQRLFPDYPGARALIRARLTRIGDSCGFGVPYYHYEGERETLTRWAETRDQEGLAQYRERKNARSVNGLPGLDAGD